MIMEVCKISVVSGMRGQKRNDAGSTGIWDLFSQHAVEN